MRIGSVLGAVHESLKIGLTDNTKLKEVLEIHLN
ncbi:hypothetical protein ACV242_004990 [Peribacillus simplex]